MCVAAYTTVLFLEFLSPVCEKFGLHLPLRLLRWIEMPLVVAAAAISTLHQSTLGTFFLIAVDKLHNLWYNPLLPLLFWISAICTGMCIIIIEASACHKWMGQPNEATLLCTLAKIMPWTLGLYIFVRLFSLFALSDGPFRFSRDEIVELRFWSAAEVGAAIGTGVFTPNLETELGRLAEVRPWS